MSDGYGSRAEKLGRAKERERIRRIVLKERRFYMAQIVKCHPNLKDDMNRGIYVCESILQGIDAATEEPRR